MFLLGRTLPTRCAPRLAIVMGALTMAICASAPALAQSAPAGQTQLTEHLTGTLTLVQPRRVVRKASPVCPDVSLKIESGDALTTYRKPEQGLDACRAALEAACNAAQSQAARNCIQGAIAQRVTLDYIDSRLRLIDYYLGCHWCNQAYEVSTELQDRFGAQATPGSKFAPLIQPGPRQQELKSYVEMELAKRPGLQDEQHWVSRSLSWVGQYFGVCPVLRSRDLISWLLASLKWLARVLFWLFLAWAALQIFGLWWRGRNSLGNDCWIVWSIGDDSKCGAAGAVMDALDFRSNSLLARYFSNDAARREWERRRRQFLLAPPFFSTDNIRLAQSALVWLDFLEAPSESGSTRIEKLPGADALPHFVMDNAYDEIDVTVAGFALKGIYGLYRNLKRYRDRNFKSVIGVVSESKREGGPSSWSVRLNANEPGTTERNRTMSVYADSVPMSYGDPLGQVAERAAFKLVLRIVSRDLDGHDVTAVAAFRQGVELLLLAR